MPSFPSHASYRDFMKRTPVAMLSKHFVLFVDTRKVDVDGRQRPDTLA